MNDELSQALATLQSTLTLMLNPEYWALTKILSKL